MEEKLKHPQREEKNQRKREKGFVLTKLKEWKKEEVGGSLGDRIREKSRME